eukprot:1177929-Prorocentrum_minimum.AAC.2
MVPKFSNLKSRTISYTVRVRQVPEVANIRRRPCYLLLPYVSANMRRVTTTVARLVPYRKFFAIGRLLPLMRAVCGL